MESLENMKKTEIKHKIFFGVVVYNKNFEESETCKKLKEYQQMNVYIADNSTIANDLNEKCQECGWNYIQMNGNKGISKAYNKIIENIMQNNSDNTESYIIWIDDDTEITKQYIDKVSEYLENTEKPADIICPIIINSKNEIISPSIYKKIKFFKVKKISDVMKIKYKNFIAINTCLVVKMYIYKNYRYYENLFLDNVDHKFINDMKRKNKTFKVIEYIVKQNFFSSDNKNYEKEINRKKIEIKDYKYFIKDEDAFIRFLYFIRVFYWKIKGCIKYKTLKYFRDLS